MRDRLLQWLVSTLLAAAMLMSGPAEHSGWLDAVWQRAVAFTSAETGGAGTSIDRALTHLKALPEPPPGMAHLAAHAGSEGHWTFVNRQGETFTVGTPDEMARVVPVLAPEAADPKSRLSLLLTADTVFYRLALLKDLPKGALLSIVAGARSFPLVRSGSGKTEQFYAALRPNLHIALTEPLLLSEALSQLERPLPRDGVRVLSLEPGAVETLVRTPKTDAKTGRPPVDAIDPYKLPASLGTLRGQTAILVGRIAGNYLAFRPSNGAERTILLGDLTTAATRADADLVIVQSPTPHQPGTRNWLWQRFEVDGLSKGLDRRTLADLLEAVAGQATIAVTLTMPDANRAVLRAAPSTSGEGLGGVLQDMTAGVTGSIRSNTIEAHLVSTSRRNEISLRLVPLVPFWVQASYLGGLALGLAGFGVARRWYARLWPTEQRDEYAGAVGYYAARIIKLLAFAFLFLPLAGPLAFLATLLRLPGRLVKWLIRSPAPQGGQPREQTNGG